MEVKLIFARAANGVIGAGNAIPWHLPEDLARFKKLTLGHPVIMGRKTWDSLPARFRPLPGRRNIVLTRQTGWHADGAEVAHSIDEALEQCRDASEAWVIGGAEIYAQALPHASAVEVTEIEQDFEGDAMAPPLGPEWQLTARDRRRSADGLPFSFVSYRKFRSTLPMSDHGFHVHGPHDHELEHAAQGGHDAHDGGMTSQIAVVTAIIATVGAIFSYMGGATQANAGLYKNNAAIKKTEASNQWNYYQAKSNKQNLSELALDLASAGRKDFYVAEVKRYKGEKEEIKTAAEKLEAEAKSWDDRSEAQMHQHHRWAQATTVLQVSIALAAIALLTRRKWLEWGMFGVAGVGIVIGVLAMLHI